MSRPKGKERAVEEDLTTHSDILVYDSKMEDTPASQYKRKSRVRSHFTKMSKKRGRREMEEEDLDNSEEAANVREQHFLPTGSSSQPIELENDEHEEEDEEMSDGDAAEEIAAFQQEEQVRHLRLPRRVQTARGTSAPRNYFEPGNYGRKSAGKLDEVDEEDDQEFAAPRRSTRAQSAVTRPDNSPLQHFQDATANLRPGIRQSTKVKELQQSEAGWKAEFKAKQKIMLEQYQELEKLKLKFGLYERAFGAYDDQVNEIRRLANINNGDGLAANKNAAAASRTGTNTAGAYKLHTNTPANFAALPIYRPPPPPAARLTKEQKRAAQPSIDDLDDEEVARGLFNSDVNINIRGLKQQVQALRVEVRRLEAEPRDKDQQIDDLNTELDEKNVELDDLQYENDGIKRQIASQRVKNATQGEEIEDLKKQLEQLDKERQIPGYELETQLARTQDLEQQLGSQTTEIQELKDRLHSKQQQATDVQGFQDQLRQQSGHIRYLEDQLQQQVTRNQDLQGQRAAKKATVQNILRKLDNMAETNNKAQAELAHFKANPTSNNMKMADQADQLKHLNARWSTAVSLMKEFRVNDIDGLRKLIVERTDRLRQLRDDKNAEIAKLKTEASSKTAKITDLEAELTTRDTKVKKLESEVTGLNKNIAAFIKQADQMKVNFKELGKRCEKRISYLAQNKEVLRSNAIPLPVPIDAFTGWNDEKPPADAVAAWRGER